MLQDLRDKVINNDDVLTYLSFMDWEKQKDQHRNDLVIKKQLIGECLEKLSVTPEDILVEQERLEEIIQLVLFIKNTLSEKEFDILWLSTVEGWTQDKIAKKYNTYQKNISRILKKTQKCCLRLLSNPTILSSLFREPQSKLEAHSPESIGYPYEFLQDINDGGEWKNCGRSGKKYYTKSKCALPEYFEGAFGDSTTVCSLCYDDWGVNHCTRQEEDQRMK